MSCARSARLPFNQRAALAMRELEGRSYAEIADTIGVSVSAVETLIFRARKTLRLKASSLRSLAAVPLPTSLARLFEGGGVVAGGGAAVGTGLVMKAAVAIVAAALGTGVGGDRSRPATAATHPGTGSVLAPSSKGAEDGLKTQQVGNVGVRVRESATSKGSPASGATGRAGDVTAVGSGQATAGQTASTTQASSNQSGPVSQVTAPVSDLTSTVQQVVEAPTAALPVQPPSLPTPPIDVPTVPQVPLPPPPLPLP